MNNYWKKLGSGVLALLMVVQMGVVPVSVAEANSQPDVQGASVTSENLYQETTPIETKTLSTSQEYIDEVVRLVNIERVAVGAAPLGTQDLLTTAAGKRAIELNTWFSHFRPDGTSYSTVLDDYGVVRASSGENIAMGHKTPEAVVEAWMKSDGHRSNILNQWFDYIGVGYDSTNNAWVQVFISTEHINATSPTLNNDYATHDVSSGDSYKILVVDGSASKLVSVEINGVLVPYNLNNYYTCPIYFYVELKQELLQSLGGGVHIVTLTYEDGTVLTFTLTLTGIDAAVPQLIKWELDGDDLILTFNFLPPDNFNWLNDRAIYLKDYQTDETILTIEDRMFYSLRCNVLGNTLTIPLVGYIDGGYYYIEIDDQLIGSLPFVGKEEGVVFWIPLVSSSAITMSHAFSEATNSSSSVTIDWDDNWFLSPSFENGKGNYIHDLAISSIALSGAAYDSTWTKNALSSLGFSGIDSNYTAPTSSDYNTISFTIAQKTIYENGTPFNIIAVIIKGTNDDAEWQSNFNISNLYTENDMSDSSKTNVDTHQGFQIAAESVLARIDYLCGNLDSETTRYYVTGHSRGGAVANLVAASLNDDSSLARQENVYAYTFAAPTVSTNGKITGYENIINITNGEDFISQAPLAKWGFGHYGIDLMLPSKSNYKYFQVQVGDKTHETLYETLLHNMNLQFEELVGDKFVTYSNGVESVNKALNSMYALAKNLNEYYTEEHSYSWTSFKKITPYDYFTVIAEISQKIRESGDISDYGHKYSTLKSFFKYNSVDEYDDVDWFFLHPYIGMNHSVSAYYSWLKSSTPEVLFGSVDTTNAANYKKINVACPVDVYVYDSQDNLVASVVNDAVDVNILAIGVYEIYDEEDNPTGEYEKIVHLPEGEEFRIEIVGTDDGTMEYAVEEMTATGTGSATDRLVSFDTIGISNEQILTATINDTVATSVENYALETNGEKIEASSDVFFNESTFEITLDPNGGICATTSITTNSDGTLSTLPTPSRSGYNFNGWYTAESGGTKITTSYVFSADTTIYAQWSETGTSGDDSQSGSTGGSSSTGTPSASYTTPILKVSTGGTATITPEQVQNGKVVTITTVPQAGYILDSITVIDADHAEVEVTKNEDGTHKFTQPIPKVTIQVTFVPEEPKESIHPEELFQDVNTIDWYYSSVKFVLEEGLMAGMGNNRFAPDDETQRAMILTMLYSLAEKPMPSISSVFSDVSTTSYYAKPVAWAEEQQIISSNESSFYYPESDIPREEICVLLYNYVKTQTDLDASTKSDLPFNDNESIGSSAKDAVLWCYENGVVSGRDGGMFDASASATRAEIATMIRKFVLLLGNEK